MRTYRLLLPVIMLGYLAMGLWGISWGTYADIREGYLFDAGQSWDQAKVLSTLRERPALDDTLGADVDPNPVAANTEPVALNDSDDKIAEIYTRYLLYSHQPDEMIAFKALSHIDPGGRQFDPKLYQYGGLFIYPLGVLVKLASLTGWLEIGNLEFLMENPRHFAKFYVLGRLYVLLWGLLGVWGVAAIATHLADRQAGLLSAVLFAVSPVVVSLTHESKPHLPGAVLMLWATFWALKYIETGRLRHRLLLALFCGLAVGMVLSSVWILLLIPLVEFLTRSSTSERLVRSVASAVVALLAYGLTNPYVPINLLTNRQVLISNFSNSTAMYQIGRLGEGVVNAGGLLVEASCWPIVFLGLVLCVALWGWDWRRTLVVLLPALLVFAQFVALAADKPGEYGRFMVFPSVVLCIVCAVGVYRFLAWKWYQSTVYALALATLAAWPALDYVVDFRRDQGTSNSRYQLAARLQQAAEPLGVLRDPAPYCFPPLDFASRPIVKLPPQVEHWPVQRTGWPRWLIVPLNGVEGVDVQKILADGYYMLSGDGTLPPDDSPISWANKPLVLLEHKEHGQP